MRSDSGPAPVATRSTLAHARRVVVKLGTSVLTAHDGSVARERLGVVADAVAGLAAAGREPLVVTSGAVGLGMRRLGLDAVPVDLEDRQACAAAGQSELMRAWGEALAERGLVAAQVLLTESDLDDRERYLNLRGALLALIRRGAVPVINENDVVSTDELAFSEGRARPVFGDNDRLSALVATKLDAELLVLLTDVLGVFDRGPDEPGAVLLERVDDVDVLLPELAGAATRASRGGMRSKVASAALASRGSCDVVVASGLEPERLPELLAGESVGTWFPARGRMDARRRWIAFAAAPRGVLVLDDGAVAALRERGASLLAAGVTRIEGSFVRGDVVEMRDSAGGLVGRGIVYCDRTAAERWRDGLPPAEIRNHDALVNRDHMVLEVFDD